MPAAVVVSACRTASGTACKGTLTETTAVDLAHAVIEESFRRTHTGPEEFDDVVFGESLYGRGAIARHAAVTPGLTTVPGMAQNQHCALGLAAVQTAAAGIRAGMDDAVIAGGAAVSASCRWARVGAWAPPPSSK
jgi:acetyl-CoA acyltransferase